MVFTCVKTKVADINFVEIIITFINRTIHPDRGDTISIRIFLWLTHLKLYNGQSMAAKPCNTFTMTSITKLDNREMSNSLQFINELYLLSANACSSLNLLIINHHFF